MPLPSPSQFAKNWRSGMANSGEKLKAGVQAVTEAPTAKAARRIDAMVAGIQRAAADGSIQRGLERVTLEDWKQAMLQKGAGRVAAGAAAAEGTVADFAGEFLPHLQAGMNKLQNMPRGDLETNLARANEMARHNATFKRGRK